MNGEAITPAQEATFTTRGLLRSDPVWRRSNGRLAGNDQEGGHQIHIDDVVMRTEIGVLEGGGVGDACIVDDGVKATVIKRLPESGNRIPDLIRISQVHLDWVHTGLLGESLAIDRITIGWQRRCSRGRRKLALPPPSRCLMLRPVMSTDLLIVSLVLFLVASISSSRGIRKDDASTPQP